ncbi:hypothetical protein Ancab_019472 [Ancistrocladus abbreviatus]
MLFPPNWIPTVGGETSAEVFLFVLALADKLHAARKEIIHRNANLNLTNLMSEIAGSFNKLGSLFLQAQSQYAKISSGERIIIFFDAVIEGSYSMAAVIVGTPGDPRIHLETMKIDSTDMEVAQANAAWMATAISLRWPNNERTIYGNNENIIRAIYAREGAPCPQGISKIILHMQDLPHSPNLRWIPAPAGKILVARKLAAWAAKEGYSGMLAPDVQLPF